MSQEPLISVCIPCYDMGGRGAEFLDHSLRLLAGQRFKDFEVVVSDQSETDAVAGVCARHGEVLTIRRLDFKAGPRQASANTNNAIRQARGRIVKVLFQDDFLCLPEALGALASAFADTDEAWALMGSGVSRDGQTLERPMVPAWHDTIRFGKNTVSSPSVLAFSRVEGLEFDENLIWLMDVEMYHRCHARFGSPIVLPQTMVANRLHAGQVSAGVSKAVKRHELRYVAGKHGLHSLRDFRVFAFQYLKSLR